MKKRNKKNNKKRRRQRSFHADRKIRISSDWKIFAFVVVIFLILVGFGMIKLNPPPTRSLVNVPEFNEFAPPANQFGPVEPQAKQGGQQTQQPNITPPLLPPHGQGQAGSGVFVPVLMYHHVGDTPIRADAIRRDLTVSTKDFGTEVSMVEQLGYHSITAAQLSDYLHGTGTLPDKPILFTFDDGYDDVFQNAAPILAAHHMTGSFAIITGFVGQTGYVSWPTLQQAVSSGMELVCHSEHHMDFTNKIYTTEMKTAEVADCKQDLLNQLGVSSRVFIYPYGHYDGAVERILTQNNFDISFTTKFGYVKKGESLLELPRVRVHGVESLGTFERSLGVSVLASSGR